LYKQNVSIVRDDENALRTKQEGLSSVFWRQGALRGASEMAIFRRSRIQVNEVCPTGKQNILRNENAGKYGRTGFAGTAPGKQSDTEYNTDHPEKKAIYFLIRCGLGPTRRIDFTFLNPKYIISDHFFFSIGRIAISMLITSFKIQFLGDNVENFLLLLLGIRMCNYTSKGIFKNEGKNTRMTNLCR